MDSNRSNSGLAVVGVIALAVVVVVVAIVVSYYGGILGNHVQANYNKRVVTSQIQQNVRTPEFAQATYEQFFKDCNSFVAANAQIKLAQARVNALKAQPDDAFGQKANKVADALTDLTGIQQQRENIAASYNASASEYTRGQFLDASLPARIVPPYDEVRCS